MPLPLFTAARRPASVCAVVLACAALWSGQAGAQQAGDSPVFRLGLSAGLIASDNRGLDATSAGSTFEYFSRLDFGLTFATPIQQLEISGNIDLRQVNGAESSALRNGFVEPDLAIGYARQSRDATLSVNLRFSETDVSSNTLEDVIGVPDPVLVTEDGTRRNTVLDTELELRRRAPFGVTLFAGFTGLRYSDTSSTTLTDQDRFRIGTRLRFDLNPSTRLGVTLRYSTFEDLDTAQGVRETYQVRATLRQELGNGDATFRFSATDTEDGTRYTLSAGRSLRTALWDVSGSLGLTRDLRGDVLPVASLNVSRTLQDGTLEASFERRFASGSDDEEQQITSLSVSYARQLTALTRFNTSLSYSETDETGAVATSSFGTLGVSLQRSLTADVSLNVGLQHRVSEDSNGVRARDNRLSITLRRDLTTRR